MMEIKYITTLEEKLKRIADNSGQDRDIIFLEGARDCLIGISKEMRENEEHLASISQILESAISRFSSDIWLEQERKRKKNNGN